MCVCMFIPSLMRVGTLILVEPGTPNGASIHIFSHDVGVKELFTLLTLHMQCRHDQATFRATQEVNELK